MGTDRLNRFQTTAAVLLVAAIAAVVSFIHIEHLARAHGQILLAAILIPLSIDGTVAAMSGVMLSAARSQMPTPPLARFMLALAVLATLLANVASGLPSGWLAALIAGWPAVAFVGCVEVSILWVRRARSVAAAPPAEGQPEPLTDSRFIREHAPAPAALPHPQSPPPVTPWPPSGGNSREGAPKQKAAARRKAVRPSDAERVAHLRTLLKDGRTLTIDGAMEELKAGRPVAKRILEAAMSPNGNGVQHG